MSTTTAKIALIKNPVESKILRKYRNLNQRPSEARLSMIERVALFAAPTSSFMEKSSSLPYHTMKAMLSCKIGGTISTKFQMAAK